MPEYLAPGVYVEETSFRAKSIEGVGTSTTGFVGATRYGPIDGEPELMTSFSQFERIYGGLDPLNYDGTEVVNYLAHAVRAFFDNGGSRLYVARAYQFPELPEGPIGETAEEEAAREALLGLGTALVPAAAPQVETVSQAAIAAASTIFSALDRAIARLQQAQAGATTILRFAIRQVQLAAPTVDVSTDLDYAYGEDGDDIGAQLSAAITALPDGDDKTALQTAQTTWQSVIDAADDALQSTVTPIEVGTNAQTAVQGAYETGAAEGATAALPGAAQLGILSTAGNTATTTANTIAGEAAALPPLGTALTDALAGLNSVATSTAATTAVENLVTAAQAVIIPAQTADDPITTAARLATVEGRVAIANATTDWVARFPGAAGNMTVVVTGRLATNVLMAGSSGAAVKQIRPGDLVVLRRGGTALVYSVQREGENWQFQPATGSPVPLSGLSVANDAVIPLTLTVEVLLPGKFAQPLVWDNLTVSNLPSRVRDSVTQVFNSTIANRLQELETPVILQPRTALRMAQLAGDLLDLADWEPLIADGTLSHSRIYGLTNGSDGQIPEPTHYRGLENSQTSVKSGLLSLADLEEISIVAAPGYSYTYNQATRNAAILTISQDLITHCENLRYRVAVLDSPNDQSLSGVREYRALLDTTRAALYYPWVRILDPVSDQEIALPPSGFMAGIYAHNDGQTGVHKAPANEVVRGAIGLELVINKAQQDILNPLGINCIRFFEGRGIRVWGARTISSDPEWKYLNIRRYFVFLEASIDRSTQWAVFEPNGEQLWAKVRRTVEGFLENEWREGHLAGSKLEEAFFVRCDRSTMTQNDLDNGRMICLIGVAPLYPAEFVIFRIGQWTADRR